jgi:AcrR family transcriptional regulator
MISRTSPREQLLRAGSRLIGRMDTTALVRAVPIAAVVQEAGLSHQTFHNTYPGTSRSGGVGGKEAFVDDLLGNFTMDYQGAVLDADPSTAASGGAEFAAVFDELSTGLMRRRMIAALLACDHDRAREAITPEFERLDDEIRTLVSRAVHSRGGSVRQPLSLPALSTVFGALLDGLAMRELINPGSTSTRDVAAATESLLGWAIDPLHSDRSATVPAPDGDLEAEIDAHRPDLETEIVTVTESLFAENGYFLVSLADIAVAARVRVDDLKKLFPSKVDIIVAALTPEFDRVQRLRRADEKLGVEPAKALRRTLTAIAEFVIDNRAMSSGMLMALSFEQLQHPSTITTVLENLYLPSAVAPILERGRASAIFGDQAPITEVAVMLTNNVLFRCLTRPGESATDVVDGVLRVLLPGVDGRST